MIFTIHEIHSQEMKHDHESWLEPVIQSKPSTWSAVNLKKKAAVKGVDVRTVNNTNFFRTDGLPYFLTHDALRACLRGAEIYNIYNDV